MREEEGKITTPRIVFEDEYLVVIEKPYGVVVNNAESVKTETIQSWFSEKITERGTGEFFEKGGIVHRLDKDTSGVMVLAKTEEAYNRLKQQFLERKTIKKYLALVHGRIKEETGTISKPIVRNPRDRHKFSIGDDLSRTSITDWQVLKVLNIDGEFYSLVELTPHTGRTHQLRVHMQSLNHPIVSDPIYGWQKKVKNDFLWCPRLFLHARSLQFLHPGNESLVEYRVELSQDLQQVLDKVEQPS